MTEHEAVTDLGPVPSILSIMRIISKPPSANGGRASARWMIELARDIRRTVRDTPNPDGRDPWRRQMADRLTSIADTVRAFDSTGRNDLDDALAFIDLFVNEDDIDVAVDKAVDVACSDDRPIDDIAAAVWGARELVRALNGLPTGK